MTSPTKKSSASLQYPYQYQTFRRVKLASVKDGIFHPAPPSLRRIDTDNAMHKMPDEHSQTTTIYGEKDFKKMAKSGFRKSRSSFAKEYATAIAPPPQFYKIENLKGLPEMNKEKFSLSDSDWKRYADTTKRFQLPRYDPKYYRFHNYVVRYIEKEPTTPTRFSLRQEPSLNDSYDQMPLPYEINNRYRITTPRYKKNHISTWIWY